jgi:hypothetical protein
MARQPVRVGMIGDSKGLVLCPGLSEKWPMGLEFADLGEWDVNGLDFN